MSLIPLMKMRLASPMYIIDINRIEGLDYIRLSPDGKTILVGSLARHRSIETSPTVLRHVPLMSETAAMIGDPQIRNRGTIGGSLAHSDPSGDWAAAVIALGGAVRVSGSSGERTIPIEEFLVDTFTTALKEDEIVTQVSAPVPAAGSGSAYLKLERKAGDFATVGVAAQLTLDQRPDGDYCSYAGIGLTAVGPKSLRARGAESCLAGKLVTQRSIAEASQAASNDCQPTDDPLRGSAGYKREMTRVYTRRALTLAAERARKNRGSR